MLVPAHHCDIVGSPLLNVVVLLGDLGVAREEHGAPHGEVHEDKRGRDAEGHDAHPLETLGDGHAAAWGGGDSEGVDGLETIHDVDMTSTKLQAGRQQQKYIDVAG